ncbi:MAG: fatty acid desaturase, partial [Synechococcaceae cyanobacterium]|nr:fatty acid desaturase [Synechococcaceae cyanobacterium]
CFHFGYHREHHDNPGLSWFQLPSARRRAQKVANRPGCL